jgi:concanavalin A-like lectin/glucanase superfamily protein
MRQRQAYLDKRRKPTFGGTRLNVKHPLIPNLNGCWVLNEAAGPTAYDMSPSALNGTITTPVWKGTALDFGLSTVSAGNEIDIGDQSAVQNNVFSIAARFLVNGTTGFRGLWGSNSAGAPVEIRVDDTSNAVSVLKQNTALIGTSTKSVTASVVTDLLVTYDSSGNLTFYLQGSAAGTAASAQTFGTSQDIRIGRSADGMLNGTVLHVYYWGNRVLTAANAASLHVEPYAFLIPKAPRVRYFHPAGTTSRGSWGGLMLTGVGT